MLCAQTPLEVSCAHVAVYLLKMALQAQVLLLMHALGSPCVQTPLNYIVLSISDINECGQGTDNCHATSHCTYTVESFQCDCLPGFEGNGVTCNGKVFTNAIFAV